MSCSRRVFTTAVGSNHPGGGPKYSTWIARSVPFRTRHSGSVVVPAGGASPVLAGGKIYVVSRFSGTFVFAAKPEFEQIAQNQFPSDETFFNATPAICDGELFLRSNKYLYCIADEGEQP